jgi:hypothetical protein
MAGRTGYVAASLAAASWWVAATGCASSGSRAVDQANGGTGGAVMPAGGAPSTGGVPAGGAAGGGAAGGMTVEAVPAPPAAYWEYGDGNTTATAIGLDAAEDVYVAGITQANLGGSLVGTFDTYVRKYDLNGNVLWTLQWGQRGYNYLGDIAVEPDGTFYVTGNFIDYEPGTTYAPTYYLNKYDAGGTMIWTQQTTLPTSFIAVDGTHDVYVTGAKNGSTGGCYLQRFDSTGAPQWTTPFGIPIESPADVTVDGAGDIYVATNTLGTIEDANTGVYHGLLYKLDSGGNLSWTQPVADPTAQRATAVAVDSSGNAYLTGYTDGTLGFARAGGDDVFLRKYAPDGSVLWTQQFGTPADDLGLAVAVDTTDNPYVAGITAGMLAGPMPADSSAFVRKYDASGAVQWTAQCPDFSRFYVLAVAASGNIYGGGLGGPPPGGGAMITKFAVH